MLGHLVQSLSGSAALLDGLAAQLPQLTLALAAALREGVEPFPQLEEASRGLDQVLEAQRCEGFSAAVQGVFRALLQLPPEEQRDVFEVLHAVVSEKMLQVLPVAVAAASAPGAHQRVVSGGCGAPMPAPASSARPARTTTSAGLVTLAGGSFTLSTPSIAARRRRVAPPKAAPRAGPTGPLRGPPSLVGPGAGVRAGARAGTTTAARARGCMSGRAARA
mmetsp:Transcript_58183/g.175932  ORF Transcript_58183/g.175932 Transcript_58183/m.175932 type:complete len:220 (+) Transcript_58183:1-660(+)